jgi:hypothetical protein
VVGRTAESDGINASLILFQWRRPATIPIEPTIIPAIGPRGAMGDCRYCAIEMSPMTRRA